MAWQSTTCIRKNGAGKHAFFSKKRVFRNFGPLVGVEDSVNFVFDSIFVFVIVFVNEKVFSLSFIYRF